MARLIAPAALTIADAGVLAGIRPRLALVRHLSAPHRWLAEVGPDAAAAELAAAALWLAAAWLAVGLAAACAAGLPGAAGRISGHIASAVLPRALHRLVAGAAGIGVLISPVLAGAVAPDRSGGSPAGSRVTQASAQIPTPVWPSDDALPAPVWPTSAARVWPTSAPTSEAPVRPTSAPTPAPTPAPTSETGTAPMAARAEAAPSPAPSRAHHAPAVVVRPGDSLWRIAADRLAANPADQRIAAAWPRWYAINRGVVGDNPDHIVPGQVLHAPDEENPS